MKRKLAACVFMVLFCSVPTDLRFSHAAMRPSEQADVSQGPTAKNFPSIRLQPLFPRPEPPKMIWILGTPYHIEVVKKIPVPNGETFWGWTCDRSSYDLGDCPQLNTIYIDSGLSLQKEQGILVHEIQHGIFGTQKSDETRSLHSFINKLSPRFLTVIQDNPALLEYLKAREVPMPQAMR